MNKRSRTLIAAGIALLLAALLLTGYNLWDAARADSAAGATRDTLSEAIGANLPVETDEDEPVFPDYLLNPEMPMPTAAVDGLDYIGLLELPALELSLPVASEWSYDALKLAPCRYAGSAYQDDLVIAAHNYRSHFGRLARSAPGDEVRFTDMDGNTFVYEVAELETLPPTAVEEMTDSGYDLTLFTCTLGGQTRLTVRCTLVDRIPAET